MRPSSMNAEQRMNEGHNTTRVDTAVEQSQTLVSLIATNFSQKYNICSSEYLKEFVVNWLW